MPCRCPCRASGKRQRTQFLKSQQPLEPVHRADFCNKIGPEAKSMFVLATAAVVAKQNPRKCMA
jgi:hypothetical protein